MQKPLFQSPDEAATQTRPRRRRVSTGMTTRRCEVGKKTVGFGDLSLFDHNFTIEAIRLIVCTIPDLVNVCVWVCVWGSKGGSDSPLIE